MEIFDNSVKMLAVLDQIRSRSLVLFGSGEIARLYLLEFRSYGIEPVCFTTENKALTGSRHFGLPVYDFEEVKERYPICKVFISINRKDVRSIRHMQHSLLRHRVCQQEDIVDYIFDEETGYHRIALELRLLTSIEQISRLLSTQGNLVIYGANMYGRFALDAFRAQGVEPSGFCEIEAGRRQFCGLPVLTPSEAISKYQNRFVYAAMDRTDPRLVYDVERSLIECGVVKASDLICRNNAGLFYSCYKIEYALDFAPDGIRFCCISPLEGIQLPYVNNLLSNTFDPEMVISRREELRTYSRQPAGHCAACNRYKLKTWMPSNKIKYISFNAFYRCQLSCAYCFDAHICEDQEEVTCYDIFSVLQQLHSKDMISQNISIWLAGGEPTLYKDFEKLLDFFHNYYPLASIEVCTNAVIFSKHLSNAMKSGLATINVSVDAGTALTYKCIKGKDIFYIVYNNIVRYGQHTNNNTLKYILMPNNCDDTNLKGFIELCKVANIHKISLSRDDFKHNEPFTNDEIYAMRKLLGWAISNDIAYEQSPPLFSNNPFNRDILNRIIEELHGRRYK